MAQRNWATERTDMPRKIWSRITMSTTKERGTEPTARMPPTLATRLTKSVRAACSFLFVCNAKHEPEWGGAGG